MRLGRVDGQIHKGRVYLVKFSRLYLAFQCLLVHVCIKVQSLLGTSLSLQQFLHKKQEILVS